MRFGRDGLGCTERRMDVCVEPGGKSRKMEYIGILLFTAHRTTNPPTNPLPSIPAAHPILLDLHLLHQGHGVSDEVVMVGLQYVCRDAAHRVTEHLGVVLELVLEPCIHELRRLQVNCEREKAQTKRISGLGLFTSFSQDYKRLISAN